MNLALAVELVNALLEKFQPAIFNSSWIRRHAPHCYRFIQNHLRAEFGGIDWDQFTSALDRRFQRRWTPARRTTCPALYQDGAELDAILEKYRNKLYVFVTSQNQPDRRIRDLVSIKLVRLAQKGNLLAQDKMLDLIADTIRGWMERDPFISRWRGYEGEIPKQVVACVRRYRYTGSFVTYLFRTLACGARGIRPVRFYPLE